MLGDYAVIAQTRSATFENYIRKYAPLAVNDRKEYGIPASITLSQALLESGAGQSALAVRANNHFGIKCNGWTGAKAYFDDDRPSECFRKYSSVGDSYADHSAFLKGRERYASLFKLKITDYKGWARGLQQAGYATDKAYANRLIKLIEDYELYRYDSDKAMADIDNEDERKQDDKVVASEERRPVKEKAKEAKRPLREPLRERGLEFVYAKADDDVKTIAEATGRGLNAIMKYNEIPDDFPLQEGDIIYLSEKKSRADRPYYDHVVRIGESMHSIAQKYGVRLESLYKLNRKNADYIPVEGDVLKLR
jgi:hypothetical protein